MTSDNESDCEVELDCETELEYVAEHFQTTINNNDFDNSDNMSCDSRTSADYEAERQYIEERFPNASFDICIDKDVLKEKLTDERTIVIKQTFTCYCHDPKYTNCDRPQPKYFVITNDNMTIENVIDELIRQNMTADCNHRFLEIFQQQTDAQFCIGFGS